MKSIKIMFSGIVLIVLLVLMTLSFSSCSKVEVSGGEVSATFKHDGVDISCTLSNEDSEIVKKIFNGETLFNDIPACYFDEDISLVIGDNTYCIGLDDCGKIYDTNNDKYFSLSYDENETLRNLLSEYGFVFP